MSPSRFVYLDWYTSVIMCSDYDTCVCDTMLSLLLPVFFYGSPCAYILFILESYPSWNIVVSIFLFSSYKNWNKILSQTFFSRVSCYDPKWIHQILMCFLACKLSYTPIHYFYYLNPGLEAKPHTWSIFLTGTVMVVYII